MSLCGSFLQQVRGNSHYVSSSWVCTCPLYSLSDNCSEYISTLKRCCCCGGRWQAEAAADLMSCMSVVRLLSLQYQLLRQSAARIVNLTSDEATAFVKSCTKYSEVILKQLPSHVLTVRLRTNWHKTVDCLTVLCYKLVCSINVLTIPLGIMTVI